MLAAAAATLSVWRWLASGGGASGGAARPAACGASIRCDGVHAAAAGVTAAQGSKGCR